MGNIPTLWVGRSVSSQLSPSDEMPPNVPCAQMMASPVSMKAKMETRASPAVACLLLDPNTEKRVGQ